MIKSIAYGVIDNPMFYKDVTQWLKSPWFRLTMLVVLLIPEALAIMACLNDQAVENPGPLLFYTSFLGVIACGIWVAFRNFTTATVELRDGTYELYEISGMSIEHLVGGRLLSIIYQFLFGFFLVVPYLFFAYFLGGVDFLEVIGAILIIIITAIPFYQMVILASFAGKVPLINTIIRFGFFFFLIFLLFGTASLFLLNNGPFSEFSRMAGRILNRMITGDHIAVFTAIVFAFFYVFGCLFLFYFTCHTACRENDSRETAVKALGTVLALGFLLEHLPRVPYGGGMSVYWKLGFVWYALALLAVSQQFLMGPLDPPVMVRRRRREAGWIKKLFYFLFPSGAMGAPRNIIFLYVAGVATWVIEMATMHRANEDSLVNGCFLLMVPYYIMVPYYPLVFFTDLKANRQRLKQAIVIVWAIAFAFCILLIAQRHGETTDSASLLLLAGPFSGLLAMGQGGEALDFLFLLQLAGGMALLGLVLMFLDLKWRRRAQRPSDMFAENSSPVHPEINPTSEAGTVPVTDAAS